MKYIITESQGNNLKGIIKKLIKNKGIEFAIKSVNGFDNFVKIMDIDSPMSFLHLFNDLEVVDSEENAGYVLFRYEPKYNLMIYNRKNESVYIDYDEIWSVMEDKFGLEYREIQGLTEEWLDEVYNLRGVTTIWQHLNYQQQLDEVYNLKY